MGQIIIPGSGGKGEGQFFQKAMKSFLDSKNNFADPNVDALNKLLGDAGVNVYLTAIHLLPTPSFELVAMSEKGTKSFRAECDANFQISGITRVKPDLLSPESQAVVQDIKAGPRPSPQPDDQRSPSYKI